MQPTTRRKWLKLAGRGAAAALLACLLAGCHEFSEDWSEASVAETELRGKKIVAAVERYRREFRFYPKDLDALAPRYLPAIQAPTVGDRVWHYATVDTGFAFQLWVEGKTADNRGYLFDSAERQWVRLGPVPDDG